MKLITSLLEGNRYSLSKLLTLVESNEAEGQQAIEALFPYTGKAQLLGVTGSPGSGKSSLVNCLVKHLRKTYPQIKVAIIAVDPSSPYTGGALLGDRIRMQSLYGDPNVYIRSMASRGALGGLAHTTAAFSQVFDAAGFDIIIIETVGAGQSEIEIAGLAHTVIVVEAPGMGDDIQSIKAGILEIADILVVNKADRPESENSARALKMMVDMARSKSTHPIARKSLLKESSFITESATDKDNKWIPPVILTIATQDSGIDLLWEKVKEHREFLVEHDLLEQRNREKLNFQLESIVREELGRQFAERIPDDVYAQCLDALQRREMTPYQAAKQLLEYDSEE